MCPSWKSLQPPCLLTILSGFGQFGIIVDGRTDRQTILQRREDTVFHGKLSVLAIKDCGSIFACAPKKVSTKTKKMMDDKIAVELDNLKLARKLQDFKNTEC